MKQSEVQKLKNLKSRSNFLSFSKETDEKEFIPAHLFLFITGHKKLGNSISIHHAHFSGYRDKRKPH